VLPRPGELAAVRAQSLCDRLHQHHVLRLEQLRRRVDVRADALALLDPARVLTRGYSVVRDLEGRIVRTASALSPGAKVALEFGEGGADAIIERVRRSER
jgi:exodeoxyribonuclease VII large subunit